MFLFHLRPLRRRAKREKKYFGDSPHEVKGGCPLQSRSKIVKLTPKEVPPSFHRIYSWNHGQQATGPYHWRYRLGGFLFVSDPQSPRVEHVAKSPAQYDGAPQREPGTGRA